MELSEREVAAQARRREESILLILGELPDAVEELRERREATERRRAEAKTDARKYDRIQARCTTQEAVKRNARRAGNSLLAVRQAEVTLEAIDRKLRAVSSGCPCGSCKTPCFLTPQTCLDCGPACEGHGPDVTVDGEEI